MARNLLVPGGGLVFEGGEIALSPSSQARTERAAEILLFDDFMKGSSDSTIYCAGGYPRLPKGQEVPDLSRREGSLMANLLMRKYGISSSRIEVEASSTSTTGNVVNVLGMVAAKNQVPLSDALNQGSELGVVTRRRHAERVVRAIKSLGCNTDHITLFPVKEEGGGVYDLISSTVFAAATYNVGPDPDRLLARDGALEKVHDAISGAKGLAKSILQQPKKMLS